jgi:hypothetical protein
VLYNVTHIELNPISQLFVVFRIVLTTWYTGKIFAKKSEFATGTNVALVKPENITPATEI